MTVKYPFDFQAGFPYTPEDVAKRVAAWQGTPDHNHYPTEKLVKDALDALEAGGLTYTPEDVDNKRSTWQETPTHTAYPSEKLVKDALDAIEAGGLAYTPEDVANKRTSWQGTPTHTAYPSEKLVKDTIDGLTFAAVGHNHDMDYAGIVHNHDSDYSALAHNHDLAYEPKDPGIQAHIVEDDYHVTAANKATWNGKQDALGFTAENSANKRTTWQVTPTDTAYPSEKLVYDSLQDINFINQNLFHNPNFDIWQRGTSFTGANRYVADRWYFATSGGSNRTITKESYASPTGGIGNRGDRHFMKIVSTNATERLFQRIEGVHAGKQLTISIWAWHFGSNPTVQIDVALRQYSDENTHFNQTDYSAAQTVGTASTTITPLIFTLTVPQLPSDQTVFTDANVLVDIRVTNTQHAEYDTMDLRFARLKAEYGTVSTEFRPPEPTLELGKCQRFYQLVTGHVPAYMVDDDWDEVLFPSVPYQARMRTFPDIIGAEPEDESDTWTVYDHTGTPITGWSLTVSAYDTLIYTIYAQGTGASKSLQAPMSMSFEFFLDTEYS